jgi:hypothetical protein
MKLAASTQAADHYFCQVHAIGMIQYDFAVLFRLSLLSSPEICWPVITSNPKGCSHQTLALAGIDLIERKRLDVN